MSILPIVAVSILCGVVCHHIAKQRGGNAVRWGVLGVLFGPLAIPFVFFIKSNKDSSRSGRN